MPSEKTQEITRQSILALCALWDGENWTNQMILDHMEARGESTSLTTLKKIRKPGAENEGFNYNLTIRPLCRVFLESAAPAPFVPKFDAAVLEGMEPGKQIDFLIDQLREKDMQIREKDQQLYHRAMAMKERWSIISHLSREVDSQKLFLLAYRLIIAACLILAAVGFATDKILFIGG